MILEIDSDEHISGSEDNRTCASRQRMRLMLVICYCGEPGGRASELASSPGSVQKSGKGPGHTCKNSRMCCVSSLHLESRNHVRPLPITKFLKRESSRLVSRPFSCAWPYWDPELTGRRAKVADTLHTLVALYPGSFPFHWERARVQGYLGSCHPHRRVVNV